ncbi:MAG: GTP 3',8-cyclase MoaA [Alphaproteobacteria bacterium]|nr:MAG: GTP 3',8-cyclase MoaA [Alphaproteobacteria bacterium]
MPFSDKAAKPQTRSPSARREPMSDPFGRAITYLRLSVTDRCDFRCVYCMSENMTFLPKRDVLTLEELDRLCSVFINKGVRKLRLTGGEPLVRRGMMAFIEGLSRHLQSGDLEELTLTTNGSQLSRFAQDLYNFGMRRINISLDTLDPDKFKSITRWGEIDKVLQGIAAAKAAGLQIKINTVAVKDFNESEIPRLIEWAHDQGFDISLIETMPLGEIDGDRTAQYLPLSRVRETLEAKWQLEEIDDRTGGPARYVRVQETGGRLGFITPHTHNFCESCNRVRLTATGQLYMCLGQEDKADLRAVVHSTDDDEVLAKAVDAAILRKPKGHDFDMSRADRPAVRRHMSTTGG